MTASGHCFTYGSLMCADIMARVCGLAVTGEDARLAGYARHPVRGEDYPGLVPDAAGEVHGLLYRDLPASAWPRLDAFEGEMYARLPVRVESAAGMVHKAWAYVFIPEYRHLLQPGEWDFARFLASGRARFESRYLGFDSLAG